MSILHAGAPSELWSSPAKKNKSSSKKNKNKVLGGSLNSNMNEEVEQQHDEVQESVNGGGA